MGEKEGEREASPYDASLNKTSLNEIVKEGGRNETDTVIQSIESIDEEDDDGGCGGGGE